MSGSYFEIERSWMPEAYDVVAYVPPGTTDVGPPRERGYELADYVADLEDLREQLGLESFDYLGHSHGGFVGALYALEHPGRIDHLVLACSAPRFSDELRAEGEASDAAHADRSWYADAIEARRARQAGEFSTREEMADLYAVEIQLWFTSDEAASRFIPGFREQRPDADALAYFNSKIAPDFDLRPRLGEIEVPTLILNGADDFFGPRISAREFSAIPGSRAVLIPNAGHFAFAEQPQRFRAELERFLTG